MVADVYAGDDAQPTAGECHATALLFRIEADADADVLSRVAHQLMFANTAPYRASLYQPVEGVVSMEIELRGVSKPRAELIRGKLSRLTCVREVDLVDRDLPLVTEHESQSREP